MPCFGRKCLHSHLNSTNHTLSKAKNGKMTIFHGKSLNSMMIPFGNVIDGSGKLRGYKSTNWGHRWWGVNHWGGWGVDHWECATCVKWAKKPNMKKKPRQMVKSKEELKKNNSHFLVCNHCHHTSLTTSVHHAQNELVSWGGPWEYTNMHKLLDQFWHTHGIP